MNKGNKRPDLSERNRQKKTKLTQEKCHSN